MQAAGNRQTQRKLNMDQHTKQQKTQGTSEMPEYRHTRRHQKHQKTLEHNGTCSNDTTEDNRQWFLEVFLGPFMTVLH